MKLPNFVCVGAGKSGTTALYHYLRQHPDVFLPPQKELQYFAWPDLERFNNGPGTARSRDDWVKTENAYRATYAGAPQDAAVGDISPTYLHAPGAPERIAALLRDVRIIVMLRNPVDKVISQYGHLRRDMREDLLLDAALDAEQGRIDDKWGAIYHYVTSSRYFEAIKRYFDQFGRQNVHVILFEDFVADPVREVRGVCRFIGVRDDFDFQTDVKTNRSGAPKSATLARAIGPNRLTSFAKSVLPRKLGVQIKTWLMDRNTGAKEPVPESTRARLRDTFATEIADLETLLGRKTGWGDPASSRPAKHPAPD
ncbi:MAG: sulfotransferase [Pseudomonadota bacterium]